MLIIGLLALFITTATIGVSSTPRQARFADAEFFVTEDTIIELLTPVAIVLIDQGHVVIPTFYGQVYAEMPWERSGRGRRAESSVPITKSPPKRPPKGSLLFKQPPAGHRSSGHEMFG